MPRTKEQIREYLRQYYLRNRDIILARTTARRLADPEADRKRSRKWRFKNKEYARRYKEELHQKDRHWMDSLKDVPCVDCGFRYPPECMDFDHVRGEKLFNIGMNRDRKPEVVLKEIAKCEIVCANCHRIRTKVRKYHKSKKLKE